MTSVCSGVRVGSLISLTCPRIDSECDSSGDCVCVCVRVCLCVSEGKKEGVDVGVRERGSVCERERVERTPSAV